jgi:glycosyltransferase involved in cell wall biosynthesis
MANSSVISGRKLVAVVTPVYNGAEFLEAAIQCVQAQTYRPLVHVILDNSSTDATPEIIARYLRADVPVITRRNPATLPQIENFNAAVKLVPADAAYFRLLCADDGMTADCIAKMMALAESADDVVMVAAIERINGEERPHRFPKESSIFEASNALARVLSDEARIPECHVLYRADVVRDDEEFFNTEFNGADTENVLRVLSRGGRFGFVHEPIVDTIVHVNARRVVLDQAIKTRLWENLLFLERFGPCAMTNCEFLQVRRRHRRVSYRRLLWWMITGKGELARRDIELLNARGIGPSLLDYADSVLSWPGHIYEKRLSGAREPKPWPADAVRPGGARAAANDRGGAAPMLAGAAAKKLGV